MTRTIKEARRQQKTVKITALRGEELRVKAEFTPQRAGDSLNLAMSTSGSPQLRIANAPRLAYN